MNGVLDTILLVDDDTVTNLMHKRQISRLGLARHVDVVTDGQSALDYLEDCLASGRKGPELVLLDINMPRMNGFEFLEEYTRFPASMRDRQTVVMASTSTLRRDRARADIDACVAAYETKPLKDDDFKRIVGDCQSTRGNSPA